MAKSKFKAVPQYIKNVTKSTMFSAGDVISSVMPNATSFFTSNSEVLTNITNDMRNMKTVTKTVGNRLAQTSTFKDLDKVKENMMDDLKTGNWYNKIRKDAELASDDMSFDFGDMTDFDFGDTEIKMDATISKGDAITANTIASSAVNQAAITASVGSSIVSSNIESANLITKNQQSIFAMMMTNNTKMFTESMNLLSRLDSNVSGIFGFTKESAKYYNNSLKLNEDVRNALVEISALNKELAEMKRNMYAEYNRSKNPKQREDGFDNILDSNNQLNIAEYAKKVKKGAKNEFDSSMIGGMFNMMNALGGGEDKSMFSSFIASPLEFLPKMIMKQLIPKDAKKSMSDLDETIGDFSKLFIYKISDVLNQKGKDNPLFEMLYNVFGVQVGTTKTVKNSEYIKTSIPFDGITKRAITDVIPTYLRKMLAVMTGHEEMIYNYESGKFINVDKLKKSRDSELAMTYNGVSGAKQDVMKKINKFNMDKDVQVMIEKDVSEFFNHMVKEGMFLNPNEMTQEKLNESGLYLNENSFRLIKASLGSYDKKKWNEINNSITDSFKTHDNTVIDLNQKLSDKGYSALYDDSMKQKTKAGFGGVMGGLDKYDKSVFDYLRDIRTILLEGIKTYSIGVSATRLKSKTSKSTLYDDRMKRYASEKERMMEEAVVTEKANAQNKPKPGQKTLDSLYDVSGMSDTALTNYMAKDMGDMGKAAGLDMVLEKTGIKSSLFDNIRTLTTNIATAPGTIVAGVADNINNKLMTFLYGKENSDTNFMDMLSEKFTNLLDKTVTFINEKIVDPLNNILFDPDTGIMTKLKSLTGRLSDRILGSKTGNTFSGGALSGIINNTLDAKDRLIYEITGKGFKSRISGYDFKDKGEGVYTKLKTSAVNTFTTLKNDLIGKKGDRQDSIFGVAADKFSTALGSFSTKFFGGSSEKLTPSQFYNDHIKDRMPNIGKGLGIGLFSGLFGPLGLLGGTLMGGAIGGLTSSDRFMKMMFGDSTKDGILPNSVLNSIKSGIPSMKKGAGIGLLMSLVTPLGIFGGTLMGSLGGLALSTDKAKEILFGKMGADGERDDTSALIKKAYVKKFKDYKPAMMKGAGLGILGSFFLPGGPIGGAVIGLAGGIISQQDRVKDFLFGKDYDDGLGRNGGLFGKLKIWMRTDIFEPMKIFAQEVAAKTTYFVETKMLNPLLESFEPLKKQFGIWKDSMIENFKKGFEGTKEFVGGMFEKHVGKPFGEMMKESFIDPMKKLFKNTFGRLGKMFMNVIAAPFQLVNKQAMKYMKQHKKAGIADYEDKWKKKKAERDANTQQKYDMKMNKIKGAKTRLGDIHSLLNEGDYNPNDPKVKKALRMLGINTKDKKATVNATEKMRMNNVVDNIKNGVGEMVDILRGIFNSVKKPGTPSIGKDGKIPNTSDKHTSNNNKSDIYEAPFMRPTSFNVKGMRDTSNKSTINNIAKNNKPKKEPVNGKPINSNPDNINSTLDIERETLKKVDNIATVIINKNKKNKSHKSPTDDFSSDDDSEGESKQRKKSKRVLDQIRDNTNDIYEEISGQVLNVGYNTELIANIMVENFGKPSKMPDGERKGGLYSIKSAIKAPFRFLRKMFGKTKDFGKAIIDKLLYIPRKVIGGVTNLVKGFGNAITGATKVMWSVVKGVGSVIGEVTKSIAKSIPALLSMVATGIKVIGQTAVEGIKVAGQTLVEVTKIAGSGLLTLTKGIGKVSLGLLDLSMKAIPKAIGAIGFLTKSLFNAGKAVVGTAFKATKSLLGAINPFKSKKSSKVSSHISSVDRVLEVLKLNNIASVEKVHVIGELQSITDINFMKLVGNNKSQDTKNNSNNQPQETISKVEVIGDIKSISDKNFINLSHKKDKSNTQTQAEETKEKASKLNLNSKIDSLTSMFKKPKKDENKDSINKFNAKEQADKDAAADRVRALNEEKDLGIKEKILEKLGGKEKGTLWTLLMGLGTKLLGFLTKAGKWLMKGLGKLIPKIPKFKNPFGGKKGGLAGEVMEEGAEAAAKKGASEAAAKTGTTVAERAVVAATGEAAGRGAVAAATKGAAKIGAKQMMNANQGPDLIKKILDSGPVQKFAGGRVAKSLTQLADWLSTRLVKVFPKLMPKLTAKWGLYTGAALLSGGLVTGVILGTSALNGASAVNRIFDLPNEFKPSATLTAIATFAHFVSENITMGFIDEKEIARTLAGWVLSDKEQAEIGQQKQQLQQKYYNYNQTNQSNVTYDDFNELKENRSMLQKGSDLLTGDMSNKVHVMEALGKKDINDVGVGDRVAVGTASFLDMASFGLLDRDKTAQNISKGWNEGVDNMKKGIDAIQKWGSELPGKINEGIEWADDGLGSLFGLTDDSGKPISISDWTGNKVNAIGESISNGWNAAMDWGSKAIDRTGQFFTSDLPNAVGDGLEWTDSMFGSLFGLTDDSGTPLRISEWTGDQVSAIGKSISEGWNAAVDWGSKAVDRTQKFFMEDIPNGISEGINWADNNLGSLFGTKDSEGNPIPISTFVSASADLIGQKISEGWDATKEWAGNAVDRTSKFFREDIPNGISSGLEHADNFFGSALGLTDDNGNTVKASEWASDMGSKTVSWFQERGKNLLDGARDLWDRAGEGINNIGKNIGKGLDHLDKQLGGAFGFTDENGNPMSLTDKVGSVASNAWSQTKQIAGDFWNGTKNLAGNIWDTIKSPFVSVGEGIDARQPDRADRQPEGNSGGGGTTQASNQNLINGVPYFSQKDNRWAQKEYGQGLSNIGAAGCGPTSMAMMVSGVTGKYVDPVEMANWSVSNGYRVPGNGTSWGFFDAAAKANGFGAPQVSVDEGRNALMQGRPVVFSGQGSVPFTKGGHFVMGVGMNSNGTKVLINDPVSPDRSKYYDWNSFKSNARAAFASNKGFAGNYSVAPISGGEDTAGTPTGAPGAEEKPLDLFGAIGKIGELTTGFIGSAMTDTVFDPSKFEQNPMSGGAAGVTASAYGGVAGTKGLSKGVQNYKPIFDSSGSQYSVDPNLMMAIAQQESGGDPKAGYPNQPAWGIMQIENTLGSEYASFGRQTTGQAFTLQDRIDPSKAIPFASKRFADDLKHYNGDTEKAVQAYNFSKYSLDMLIKRYPNNWKEHRGEMGSINGVGGSYGDKNYIEHVMQYYHKGGGTPGGNGGDFSLTQASPVKRKAVNNAEQLRASGEKVLNAVSATHERLKAKINDLIIDKSSSQNNINDNLVAVIANLVGVPLEKAVQLLEVIVGNTNSIDNKLNNPTKENSTNNDKTTEQNSNRQPVTKARPKNTLNQALGGENGNMSSSQAYNQAVEIARGVLV